MFVFLLGLHKILHVLSERNYNLLSDYILAVAHVQPQWSNNYNHETSLIMKLCSIHTFYHYFLQHYFLQDVPVGLLLLSKFTLRIIFLLKLKSRILFFLYFSIFIVYYYWLYSKGRCTNADLKICQYIRLHIWQRFDIITTFCFWDMRINLSKMSVNKHKFKNRLLVQKNINVSVK